MTHLLHKYEIRQEWGAIFSFRSLIRPFVSIVVQAAPPKTMKKKRLCSLITKTEYNQYKANSTNQEQLLASHASNAKAIVFSINGLLDDSSLFIVLLACRVLY